MPKPTAPEGIVIIQMMPDGIKRSNSNSFPGVDASEAVTRSMVKISVAACLRMSGITWYSVRRCSTRMGSAIRRNRLAAGDACRQNVCGCMASVDLALRFR